MASWFCRKAYAYQRPTGGVLAKAKRVLTKVELLAVTKSPVKWIRRLRKLSQSG